MKIDGRDAAVFLKEPMYADGLMTIEGNTYVNEYGALVVQPKRIGEVVDIVIPWANILGIQTSPRAGSRP